MGISKRRTRADAAADNDRRLAEAARATFLRRGYHGATLDQVARAAGLTKGAVYARHASKAALFLSLLEARIARNLEEIRALPAPAGAPAVDRVFRAWLEHTRDDAGWGLLVIEFRVAAARDRALNQRYAALHRRVVDAVAERVAAGAAAAGTPLPRPAAELAMCGLALSSGLLLERAAVGDALPEALAVQANLALYDGMVTGTAAHRPRARPTGRRAANRRRSP